MDSRLSDENARLREEIARLERDLASRTSRQTIVGLKAMLLTIGSSGRLMDINSAAEEYFGIRRSEVLGLPVDVLSCPPLEGPMLRALAERARAGGDRVHETVGSGANSLAVSASPSPDGVQLLISESVARHTRTTLSGYLSTSALDELGRVLVDPTQPRRHTCSVVSADLRLRGEAPAAIEKDLRNEWLDSVSAAAYEAGATVEGFSGGRLLVVFGAPVPVDQHPLWAFNTVLRMKEANRVLLGSWARRHVPAFDAGFGVDCGEVLWSEIVLHDRRAFSAIGASIERAGTLASLAGTDEILASSRAFDAVRAVLEKKPDALWRQVKFRRGESIRLRAGEEPSNAIVVD